MARHAAADGATPHPLLADALRRRPSGVRGAHRGGSGPPAREEPIGWPAPDGDDEPSAPIGWPDGEEPGSRDPESAVRPHEQRERGRRRLPGRPAAA